VRCRTQANELPGQFHRALVPIPRQMTQGDVNTHGIFQLYHFRI
jgi:hypothetical protein